MKSPRKLSRRTLIVFTLLCVAALQPAFGQSFTVKDLGILPGGTFGVAKGLRSGSTSGIACGFTGRTSVSSCDTRQSGETARIPTGTTTITRITTTGGHYRSNPARG